MDWKWQPWFMDCSHTDRAAVPRVQHFSALVYIVMHAGKLHLCIIMHVDLHAPPLQKARPPSKNWHHFKKVHPLKKYSHHLIKKKNASTNFFYHFGGNHLPCIVYSSRRRWIRNSTVGVWVCHIPVARVGVPVVNDHDEHGDSRQEHSKNKFCLPLKMLKPTDNNKN